MMSGGAYQSSEGPVAEGTTGENASQPRNPLLCFLCDDYYSEPCLLSCYHSFCSRCLRGRDVDGKLTCPLCGQQTVLKEGSSLPPVDILMRQLIELANAENPPCANCDKRDKASMYFCSTCGQALCNHCRENTHRAKMFSTHEVVHMSKCLKEGHRRCAVHGEQYIMFSNTQKNMLCVNCFRDTPAEARLQCVDIDTAYTQGCKKLDRAVLSLCDLQNSVREGLFMFKTLLDELQQNMESEKHTINSFCQGMQEAIAKTHASMIMEVQRQFETKERQFRGQLVNLGTVLPLLQLHLLLCSSFSSAANKYQFLDLAYPMMDRLAAVSQLSQPPRPVQSSQIRTNYRNEFSHALEPWVGKSVITATQQQQQAGGEMGPQVSGPGLYEPSQVQQSQQPSQQQHGGSQPSATQHFHPPPSRRQHSALRAKALEGEGPFSNHCRSFDSQIKELSQQLCGVKERLGELHRDVTLLRRAHTPPLAARYEHVTRECAVLEEQLERHQVELERLKNVFDTLWEEQLCRIHVEQEIFQSQMNDILTLRAEVKHLSLIAHQLEPYVKSLAAAERSQASTDSVQQQQQPQEPISSHQQLQSLLEHISMLQLDAASSMDSSGAQKGECRVHPGQVVTSPSAENIMYMKVDGKEAPVREVSRTRGTSGREQQQVTAAMLDVSGSGVSIYGSRQQQTPAIGQSLQNVDTGRDGKRGVLSQLIEKVRTKEDRKKSPVQEEARVLLGRERSKSDGRGGGVSAVVEGGRTKLTSGHQGSETKSQAAVGGGKSTAFRTGKGDASTQRYSSAAASSRESSSSKVASLYHTISGKVLGSRDSSDRSDTISGLEMSGQGTIASHHHLPPPPPPTTARRPQSHHEDIPSSDLAGHLDVRERLEAHLKEKLQEMMRHRLIRASSVGEKGIDSQGTEESEYQRISEATTSPVGGSDGGGITKQAVRAMIHREPSTAASTPTSPHRHRGEQQGKIVRLYPASDTEDSVFYATEDQGGTADKARKQNSCESLTLSTVSVNSRRSSVDLGDRKTLVVVIGTSSKGAKARLMQKQRSWETFPPKKRGIGADERGEGFGKFCRDPDAFRGGFELRPAQSGSQGALGSLRGEVGSLKKADSFEGHEEAVRTLVAAVQETRTQHMQQQQQQRKQSQPKQSGGGN
ncbi:RING finger protein 207 isoform X2 [Cryptotermes secundus]|uniref:RING finger protein 207 isoform X2 n=1 Tax=Cryptotermes secundus TaxID=105785 RepID=UPI001454D738|nr:RING finger protein 207 isoform X2 [Cryptotermes secundus]